MAGQARIKIQWCIKAFSSCSAFKLQIIAYPVPNVHRNFKPDQVDDRSREISSSIRLSHVIPCHPMSYPHFGYIKVEYPTIFSCSHVPTLPRDRQKESNEKRKKKWRKEPLIGPFGPWYAGKTSMICWENEGIWKMIVLYGKQIYIYIYMYMYICTGFYMDNDGKWVGSIDWVNWLVRYEPVL